jgi:hypothetical protein
MTTGGLRIPPPLLCATRETGVMVSAENLATEAERIRLKYRRVVLLISYLRIKTPLVTLLPQQNDFGRATSGWRGCLRCGRKTPRTRFIKPEGALSSGFGMAGTELDACMREYNSISEHVCLVR